MSSRIVQQTLEGLAVSAMPRVRTTDGHLLDWDREAIAKQLLKETKLSEQFYKVPGITEEEAKDIAKEVERRVRWMNVHYLSGPLVREIMNVILLERHHTEWRNICTRVGTPVFDAHLIDIGTGFEAKENANLQENAETSHKKKADKISKEQYLLLAAALPRRPPSGRRPAHPRPGVLRHQALLPGLGPALLLLLRADARRPRHQGQRRRARPRSRRWPYFTPSRPWAAPRPTSREARASTTSSPSSRPTSRARPTTRSSSSCRCSSTR